MIAEAYIEPKEREMWVGLSDKGKEIRKDEKRKRGEVKAARKVRRDDYDQVDGFIKLSAHLFGWSCLILSKLSNACANPQLIEFLKSDAM